MAEKLLALDLFAGAGGLAQGFKAEGFASLFANDHEEPALKTYRRNHPGVVTSSDDIRTLDPEQLRQQLGIARGRLDVLLGGPPCQGFSTYGKRNPEDLRNQLYQEYLRFLREFRPRTFVIENVVGILSMCEGAIVQDIVDQLRGLGYGLRVATLDAAAYGVPQFRKRVFIVGAASSREIRLPAPTHLLASGDGATELSDQVPLFATTSTLPAALSVRDAIADLPSSVLAPKATQQSLQYPRSTQLTDYQARMRVGSGELLHHSAKQMLGIRRLRLALLRPGDYGRVIRQRVRDEGLPDEVIEELLSGGAGIRDIEECRIEDRLKERKLRDALHRGHSDLDQILQTLDAGGFQNKYRRLHWDTPSHTLVAHMARDCSDFVHPEYDRFVSVREAARLQSFPDSYVFEGSQFQQFRHIGNAVPPLLGASVAHAIAKYLRDGGGLATSLNTACQVA